MSRPLSEVRREAEEALAQASAETSAMAHARVFRALRSLLAALPDEEDLSPLRESAIGYTAPVNQPPAPQTEPGAGEREEAEADKRDKNGTNVTPIEANRPHVAERAQCRRCRYGWIAVIAADANLWLLECPRCGRLWGHIPHAMPDSPYQAKVWAEEMWAYWYYEQKPGENVAVLNESPSETDGSAGSAGSQSTESAAILTAGHSRWTTSSRRSAAEPTDSTTCDRRTGDAMEDAGGATRCSADAQPPRPAQGSRADDYKAALSEATALLVSLAPHVEVDGTLSGMLSQISNAVTGLRPAQDAVREAAERCRVRVDHAFDPDCPCDQNTNCYAGAIADLEALLAALDARGGGE